MAWRAHKNCVRQHCLLVVVFCEDKVWLLKPDFASHLLSLKWRRRSVSNTAVYRELSQLCQMFYMCVKSKLYYFRQNDPVISCGKRKRSEEKEHLHNVTSKRLKRHIEDKNFAFIVIFCRSSVWYIHVLFIPCSYEKQKPNIFLEVSQ